MENSQLPLVKWFKCIYFMMVFKGISSIDMAKMIGVRQRTAWHMMQRLRSAIHVDDDIILSGIVEADETHIGPLIHRNKRLLVAKAKHNKEQDKIHGLTARRKRSLHGPQKRTSLKGVSKEEQKKRKRAKQLLGQRNMFELGYYIFGMVERNSGRIIIKVIGESRRSVTRVNVCSHLVERVSSDATLMTDESVIYREMHLDFEEHHTINHQLLYVRTGWDRNDEEIKIHTNTIENAWKNLKRMIRGKHIHFTYHHAQRYLDLFTYQWNRKSKGDFILFEEFIPNLFTERILYKDLKRVKNLTCQGHIKQAA
jgi:hypothetical protein